MTYKQLAVRIFLTGLVILLGFLPLLGCTSWQRMSDAHQALHSEEMEQAIAEAHVKP